MNIEDAFPFRIVSGFRPLKGLHIGHHAAVISDICRFQYAKRDCSFVFIADHHMRSRWDERADFANIQTRSREIAKQVIAAGIDPDFSTLYRQSDVPQLFELLWFMAGVTSDHSLKRSPTVANKPGPSVGMYLYPLLMVADILSLRATNVAIGADQRTHLELARAVASRLNRRLRNNFVPVPESLTKDLVLVTGINSSSERKNKMDGELDNDIPLFAEEDTINDRIDSILTKHVEWGEPLPEDNCNILHYVRCIGGQQAEIHFASKYGSGKYGYPNAKKELKELFFDTFGGIRRAYEKIDSRSVDEILDRGGRQAREAVTPLVFEIRREMATVI